MASIYGEFALVALAAMCSPTTLSFSVLALVLGERPLRTGAWFFLGAFATTIAIGIIAAFVIGDVAASSKPSTPKTWVAILDLVLGVLLAVWLWRRLRQPPDPARAQGMIEQMGRVASSPAIAIVAAGATLANPGGFIPIALKTISELKPSAPEYIVLWLVFTIASLLPLAAAVAMLAVAPDRAQRVLTRARGWIERRARLLAAIILILLAASLVSHGISGLTS